jgi:ribonucleoside-diphosphate reductase alpha chain
MSLNAHKLPEEAKGATHRFRIGRMKCFLTMSEFDDGTLGEIFVHAACSGSTMSGLLSIWAITFSKALQAGTPLAKLVTEPLKGSRFEPCGLTNRKKIKVATSIVDYVVRYLEMKYLAPSTGCDNDVDDSNPEVTTDMLPPESHGLNGSASGHVTESGSFLSGDICPQCQGILIYQEGCLTCPDRGCGFTRCG